MLFYFFKVFSQNHYIFEIRGNLIETGIFIKRIGVTVLGHEGAGYFENIEEVSSFNLTCYFGIKL